MGYNEFDNESSLPEESMLIGALVKALKPIIVVEIGTHNGCTTEQIIKNLDGQLWTYDIKPIEIPDYPNVHFFQGDSTMADMPGNIDFAFIDGSHAKGDVVKDFRNIEKNLKHGATVVFHDYSHPADNCVGEAIKELGIKVVKIPTYYGMAIYFHE